MSDKGKLLELGGKVIDVLKQIYDPEIPINIYDLGLVYKLDITDDFVAHIEMTLTAPNCPVAESLPEEVRTRVTEEVEEITDTIVEIVFDPPWSKEMISEAAMLELGLL
ncbi:MAG: iron-sulfur cluster assembly protein [Bacteroidota bacterium]|nr:iron-sulfur cluster assembly protein [Bacteroidota bacterium]